MSFVYVHVSDVSVHEAVKENMRFVFNFIRAKWARTICLTQTERERERERGGGERELKIVFSLLNATLSTTYYFFVHCWKRVGFRTVLMLDTRGVLDIHPCLKNQIWSADRHYRSVSTMLISKHDHSQPMEVFILPSWIIISTDRFLSNALVKSPA